MQTGSNTAGKERYGRKRPCPICTLNDSRCLRTGEVHLCWNYRKARDLTSEPTWRFIKSKRSAEGGEWGLWAAALPCPRCGRSDARCRQNRDRTLFCSNLLTSDSSKDDRWRFGKQVVGEGGKLWGFWVPAEHSSRSLRPVETGQDNPVELATAHLDWRPIHRWLWAEATIELRGRFPQKLAAARIVDTSYCRYLDEATIDRLLNEVDRRWRSGEWSAELIEASGWFLPNKAFASPLRYRTTLCPGRLIAVFDLRGALSQVRANAEVPPVIKKRTSAGGFKWQQLKYQGATRVPTRPYFPKATRELVATLQNAGQPFALRFTEGEDKAECMAQNYPALMDGTPLVWVALVGVWNFAGNEDEDLHPELVSLLSGACDVVLAFDSDVMHKQQVRRAMERLAEQVMETTQGRLVPLAADWAGLLDEQRELATAAERWGLDDLWGALARTGANPAGAIERLVSPGHARMVRRWWQRQGTPWEALGQRPWQPEAHTPLLSLDEARQQTRQTIRTWLEAGLSPLRSGSQDRIALAATCGTGKTTATMQELVEHLQRWWLDQPDPESLQQWLTTIQSLLDRPQTDTAAALWCWSLAWTKILQLAHQTFPPPGTLSEAAHQVLALQQQQLRLERKKASTLPDTPERWAVLAQLRELQSQLAALYQQGMGGATLVVFKDKKALFDALGDHVLPATGSELPPWLALRTGRESTEADIPRREQVGPGSLACAHHEAVAELGTHRHSPSAGACQHCWYGQQESCGFLDSLQEARRSPVVFATIQAVLNASHELDQFEQVICDEALDVHLVEAVELSRAVHLLLDSLQRGQQGQWYTMPPLYTEAEIQALVAVFGEITAALARYRTATDSELSHRGNRLADWCECERLLPHLMLLRDLRPLRWDRNKLEAVSASYFPWERPRYTLDETTGQPLHSATYGDEQQLAFEFIPLRATTEILGDLYEAIVRGRPGAHLTLERKLVEVAKADSDAQAEEAGGSMPERPQSRCPNGTQLRRRVHLHLVRPQQHLIRSLRSMRVLNLDATPNRALLTAFLPDMRLVDIQAEWQHARVLQILSGPMGRATSATIDQILPLATALGTQGSVLLFSHKQHTAQVDAAADQHTIEGLLEAHDASGLPHRMAWYGYQDRAVDDPAWKETDYLILAGAHRVNLGHSARLASMLRRFMATDGHQAPTLPEQPWRVESYGPQGYELVVANSDPLLDALVEHERTASMVQALQRPRPVCRTKPLTIILMRSDPLPAPFNRYVEVVSSIEELMGVSAPLGNRANHARHLEALVRHGETICDWFLSHHCLPSVRQVESHGKKLWGVGGHRGRRSSIQAALGLWAAQLLPSLQANGQVSANRPAFLEQLREAAAEHFEVNVCSAQLSLPAAGREAYWRERYRQGEAQDRLMVWMCTRALAVGLRSQLEDLHPIQEVLGELRAAIVRKQRLLSGSSAQRISGEQRSP